MSRSSMPPMQERDGLLQSAAFDDEEMNRYELEDRKSRTHRRSLLYIVLSVVALALVAAASGAFVNKSEAPTVADYSSSSVGLEPRQTSDPSVFTANPALKKSFYAIAYETQGGRLYPNCNDTLPAVISQIQLLSQLTSRLRTYGADCNQTWLVQEAIQQTKTNISVFLGVYMDKDPSIYERQITQTIAVLQQFGSANVLGVQVGNEYILNTVTQNTGTEATAQALVLSNVQDAKRRLAAAGFGSVPVGSGDAGTFCTASYAAGLDFVHCNSHPFFAGVTIEQAPTWAFSYFAASTPSALANGALSTNTTVWSGEIGWPSNAVPDGSLTLNGSIASTQNYQYMLDNFVCAGNANATANSSYPVLGTAAAPRSLPYVWFSAFDLWINYQYGGAEPFWGLFDETNTLKSGLTIPSCLSS